MHSIFSKTTTMLSISSINVYFLLLTSSIILSSASTPSQINIGIIGPQFTTSNTINIAGTHYIAAMIMAIKEINNKTDGIYDEILPGCTLKFALRSPRQNYIQALTAALELSDTVFNKNGVVGVVGTSSSDSSTATAEVFSQTSNFIPQIGYGARASKLGHKNDYPYFTRTIPSDAFDGIALANFIYYYMGLKTVTIFSSSDPFGNDASLEFKAEAEDIGLTIEGSHSFWSGIKDFSSLINQVISDGGVLKVFVLLMKSDDAGLLLEQGYKLGLFTTGTQILGTQYVATSSTWASMSSDADVAAIMNGLIGVAATVSNYRHQSTFLSFLERWRAQNSTMYNDSNGNIICDQSTDDDGRTYLYQGYETEASNAALTCVGVDFKMFADDGSDIEDEVLYAYDATYALAMALHSHYFTNREVNITGSQLMDEIVKVVFTGVSGDVNFEVGGHGGDLYGRGDREEGLEYEIINFHPSIYEKYKHNSSASLALQIVGIWSMDDKILSPCDSGRFGSLCSDFHFNTLDNSIPIDVAPIKEVQMSNSARIGLRVGGAVTLALTTIFLLIVVSCREHRIVKAAQPTMLYIVLLGSFLASIRIILATVDLTDSICIVGKWLGHLSFGLVFGAMILKTWRVHRVVHSRGKKGRHSERYLQYLIGMFIAVFCIYLLIDTLVGIPHRSYNEYFDGHYNVRLIKCQNKNQLVTIILFVLEGLLLVAGAKMCWSTKSVPDAVNDSYYIAMCLYMIIFVCAVTFPIVFLSITPTPSILITIMASGFIVATTGSTLLLFGPKTWLLWQGADVDENFGIITASDKDIHLNALATLKNHMISKKTSSGGVGGNGAGVRYGGDSDKLILQKSNLDSIKQDPVNPVSAKFNRYRFLEPLDEPAGIESCHFSSIPSLKNEVNFYHDVKKDNLIK